MLKREDFFYMIASTVLNSSISSWGSSSMSEPSRAKNFVLILFPKTRWDTWETFRKRIDSSTRMFKIGPDFGPDTLFQLRRVQIFIRRTFPLSLALSLSLWSWHIVCMWITNVCAGMCVCRIVLVKWYLLRYGQCESFGQVFVWITPYWFSLAASQLNSMVWQNNSTEFLHMTLHWIKY